MLFFFTHTLSHSLFVILVRVNVLGQCEISLVNLTTITPLKIWIPLLNSERKKISQNNNNNNNNNNNRTMMMLYARVEYKENSY